jgi:hypothetical protein
MTDRELQEAGSAVARARRRALEASALAAATAALAVVASFLWPSLILPLAAGAGIEAFLVLVALVRRRERIAALALAPEAYVLPEVERYGCRLTQPRQRRRLAESISRLVAEAHLPGNLFLADRVTKVARELEAIARALLQPTARIEPATVVACHRLLTRAVESPLYNPRLSTDELETALARIRTGLVG